MAKIVLLDETTIPDLAPMTGRSEGLHVSHIINDLCVQMGMHSEREDNMPNHVKLRMALGNALEHSIIQRYEAQYPDRFVQPGEVCHDGIFGTPDLLDLETFTIHEIKLTWMTARHAIDSNKLWKYWVQLKAYCRMMETCYGQLEITYVVGDYTDMSPKYRKWGAEFTKRELQDNWDMLKRHEIVGKPTVERKVNKIEKGRRVALPVRRK